MLFSSQSSDSLNALSATSLNPSALQRNNSTAALYTVPTGLAEGLADLIQQIGSSASSITATTEFTPLRTSSVISDSVFNVVSDVSFLGTNICSPILDTTELTPFIASSAVSDSVFNVARDLSALDLDTRFSNQFTDQVYKYGDILWLGDDTPDTARDIGHLSDHTVYSFNDHIGNSDKIDFYTFTLDSPTTVRFALTGLNAIAAMTVYPVAGSGTVLRSDGQDGRSDQLFQGSLNAGTYYVSVNTADVDPSIFITNTDYTLRLQTDPYEVPILLDFVPSLLASEHDLGTLRGSHNFSGNFHVKSDFLTFDIHPVKQYHFNLASASDLSVSISAGDFWNLVQDANDNGLVDSSELIANGIGEQPSSFVGLSPGSYFLQIGPFPQIAAPVATSKQYNLNVTATPALNSAGSALNVGSEPDDSPNQATEIGDLIGQRSFSNTVGAADKNDFYRFNLSARSNLNLSLSGLTANADMQVIRDVNHNGVVDPGDVVASSTLKGTASESINLQGLDKGFYFVRVNGAADNTSYTLNLTGTPGRGMAPEPNNTLATAYNMGTLNTFRQFSGFVGWSDPDDYYRFTLGTSRQVDLSLGGMSALADLQLLDSQGVVIASDGTYSGHSSANISRSLAAGDYMVRVQHYEDPDYFPVNHDTQYVLGLAA